MVIMSIFNIIIVIIVSFQCCPLVLHEHNLPALKPTYDNFMLNIKQENIQNFNKNILLNRMEKYKVTKDIIDNFMGEIGLMINNSQYVSKKWNYILDNGYAELNFIDINANYKGEIIEIIVEQSKYQQDIPPVCVHTREKCERKYDVFGPWECDDVYRERALTIGELNMIRNKILRSVRSLHQIST